VNPKKILLLTTFFHPDKFGGAERMIHELAREYASLGHDVTVMTHQAAGLEAAEWFCGFRILRYPVKGPGRFSFYRSVYRNARARLKELLSEETFDVIHTHQLLSAMALFFPTTLFKGPVVNTLHAPYYREFESKHLNGRPAVESEKRLSPIQSLISSILKRGDRFILNKADANIVLSRFSMSLAADLMKKTPDNFKIIPGGVDTTRFVAPMDQDGIKKNLDLPENKPVLFTVRRLVERMGLEDLIDAAGILAGRGVPFHLAIGGCGPLEADLEERAQKSRAAANIRFLGSIPDIQLPDWYRAADLFVLPTRSLEGFGMVTLEAMSSGTAVLGTDVGATSEILMQLDKDLLITRTGPTAIADSIENLIKDAGRLADLGAKARNIVEKLYKWRDVADKTLNVYQSVQK